MANDEPRPVFIENIKEIADAHQCKSTDILMELKCESIRTSEQMIHMSACFQELNATIDENTKLHAENMKDIKTILARHDTEITDLKHNCRYPQYWESVWKRMKVLEDEYQRRQGASVWDARIYEYVKYGICVILGAGILFFINGGHIN